MEINHPNAGPLSEQEQKVFEHFQKRLESMVSSHGFQTSLKVIKHLLFLLRQRGGVRVIDLHPASAAITP